MTLNTRNVRTRYRVSNQDFELSVLCGFTIFESRLPPPYPSPCSADHYYYYINTIIIILYTIILILIERDSPPCKVVFSGWQPIR